MTKEQHYETSYKCLEANYINNNFKLYKILKIIFVLDLAHDDPTMKNNN